MTRTDIGEAPASDNMPTPTATRAALNRVLASPDFKNSTRKSRFLTYVVEQRLAGRGDHLTASAVAVAVFDRDERFDPQSDPLVRATARRVRAALDHYYLSNGRSDPLRIVIPKGRYRPTFEGSRPFEASAIERHATASPQQHAAGRRILLAFGAATALSVFAGLAYLSADLFRYWQDVAGIASHDTERRLNPERIVLAPVRNVSNNPGLDVAATVISQEIRVALCCTPQLSIAPGAPADFELDGRIQEDISGIRLEFLVTTMSGRVVSTQHYHVTQITGTELADTGIMADVTRTLVELEPTTARTPR